jgi:hypothetical protein
VSDSNFDAFNARLLEMTDGGEIVLPEFDQEVGERESGGWERECVCFVLFDKIIFRFFPTSPPPPLFPSGDVWVYGAASDAAKLAEARALMRARALMDRRNGVVAAFSRMLVKLVEHTWSSDIKVSLNDTANWANPAFAARLAAKDARYTDTELTWRMQRAYVGRAVAALGDSNSAGVAKDELAAVTDGYRGPPADPAAALGLTKVELAASNLTFGEGGADGWVLTVDRATGALAGASSPPAAGAPRTQWGAGPSDPLAATVYSTYTEADYDAFMKKYLYIPLTAADAWWVTADLGKPGLASGAPVRADVRPSLTDVWAGPASVSANGTAAGVRVLTRAVFPASAVERAGAPREVWVDARAPKAGPGAKLFVDVWWVNKTATRLPEAVWVRWAPARAAVNATGWAMYKLHSPVSPLDVARNGSHGMHAVTHEGVGVPSGDGRVELAVGSLDAALVSPGAATPFPRLEGPTPAELADHGVSFCLANNVWGTNYPQWQPYGGEEGVGRTMRFRFRVGVDAPSARRAPGASPAAQAVKQALAAQSGTLGAYYSARLGARAPLGGGGEGGAGGVERRQTAAVEAATTADAPAETVDVVVATDSAADPFDAADRLGDGLGSGAGAAATTAAARAPPLATEGGFVAPTRPAGIVSFAQERPLEPVARAGGRAP